MWVVAGAYVIQEGKRDEFMAKIYEQGIIDKIRAEDGNIAYNYYYPYEDANQVYFIEQWETKPQWEAHCKAPHVAGDLAALKAELMTGFAPAFLGELTE